jgi:hypothetical protein
MEVASCGRCVQVGSGWIGWFAFLLVKLLFVSWRDVCFFYFLCREYLVYYFYFSIYLLYCSPSSFLYIFNIFFIQKKKKKQWHWYHQRCKFYDMNIPNTSIWHAMFVSLCKLTLMLWVYFAVHPFCFYRYWIFITSMYFTLKWISRFA